MLERSRFFAESWNVAWRKENAGAILTNRNSVFHIIKNSIRFWAADPFLFSYKGETYIFAELYDYFRCRGGLGYCKLIGDKTTPWKQVITEPYHLSYPFIYEKDDEVFLLPESGAARCLYQYRAVSFPDVWEKQTVVRNDVIYGDTTAFVYEGHPYALAYDVSNHEQEHLWLLDLKNPRKDCRLAVEDLKRRRPAGKFFWYKDELLRPAQICERDYGEGLVFYRSTMNHGEYREEMVAEVLAKQLAFSKQIVLDGMHTYNALDGIEVIDLKTRRFNLLNFLFRMISKFKR